MSEQELYEGPCLGGPLDNRQAESRFPEGFVLGDKANNKAWIYDWDGKSFVCRHSIAVDLDRNKAVNAALESWYDVRAWTEGDDG